MHRYSFGPVCNGPQQQASYQSGKRWDRTRDRAKGPGRRGNAIREGEVPYLWKEEGIQQCSDSLLRQRPSRPSKRAGEVIPQGAGSWLGGRVIVRASLVVIDRCYQVYRVRPSFLCLLRGNNLVRVSAMRKRDCLPTSRLCSMRQCAHVCCSLSVGVRKVSTVRRLLNQMRSLRRRIGQLGDGLELCRARGRSSVRSLWTIGVLFLGT